jgi:hypothetical protein
VPSAPASVLDDDLRLITPNSALAGRRVITKNGLPKVLMLPQLLGPPGK